jgi:hypothetical protein
MTLLAMDPIVNSDLSERFHAAYSALWRIAGSRIPIGENVFQSSWDMLIVLDGCRVDLLEQVSGDFEFVHGVDRKYSVGSQSTEWMAKTFSEENKRRVEQTAYVTANPFTNRVLRDGRDTGGHSPFKPLNWSTCNGEDFYVLDEVWAYGWNDDLGTVPPRPVTDRAIDIKRERSVDRLIVHYMQPHYPFISPETNMDETFSLDLERLTTGEGGGGGDPWELLRRGDVSYEAVWDAYKRNLEFVLEDVALLLDNVDAENVVITSDHGNALGEFGVYGHPIGYLHPSVKKVPWVATEATDTGEHSPQTDPGTDSEPDVEERLRDLGYL